MSAATRLRRLLPQADIVVLERSGYVSFANCGLPYYIGGVIEDRSALLLQTPQALAKRFGLDVRVHHEVTHIDPQRRCVQARTPDGSVASVEYDALVLSPGATPVRPPIPGIERALMLRDIEDTDALARACAGAQNAVVIGGGFIGVELAENLVHAGIEVALIESAPQVMTPLDPEMAAPVHERLRERGVELRLASAVIPVEWVEAKRTREKTRATLLAAKEAFEADRCVVIFPAGRLARKGKDGQLTDPPWAPTAISLARKYDAPIIPIHVAGPESKLFHFFDRFSGELRDVTLFHEMLNKRGKPFTLTVGKEMVMPGDNVSITVKLIAPIAMEEGLRFAIREGGRTVGAGVVAKVIA